MKCATHGVTDAKQTRTDIVLWQKGEPMSDLISRAEAIKAIRKCKFESDMPSYWYIGMEDAQNIVKTLPSADTVEVVRCKDCKHAYKRNPINKTAVLCDRNSRKG